jgi:yersiniabactin nonribosomal peptide synthetase
MDFQVKHRGFRIELDEIRYHVLELDFISDCAVVYKENNDKGYIVCFYCPSSGNTIENEQFNKALQGIIPEYMIPSKWIKVDRIPLNNNGKIDRSELMRRLDQHKNANMVLRDEGGIKNTLKRMWADVLDIDIDFDEGKSFRELGGHSILCMIIIKQIREEFNTEVDFSDFMCCKDFNEFVDLISLDKKAVSVKKEMPHISDSSKPFRLNRLQSAYLVGRNDNLSLGGKPTHLYYEAIYNDIEKEFDIDRFFYAVNTIFEMHEMLRARINSDGNQYIVPFYKLDTDMVSFTDLRKAEESRQISELMKIRAELEEYRPLLENGTLIKLHIVQLSLHSAVICVYMDSIIIDGWSAEKLLHELNDIYMGIEIENEKHHFREYNEYLLQCRESASYEADKKYWTQHIDEIAEIPCMFFKRSPDMLTEYTTRRIDTSLSINDWKAFEAKCSQHGLSTSAVMYGVLGFVISQYSINNSFSISLPIQKRFLHDRAYDDIISNCTSFLLFTYNGDSTASWMSLFRMSHEQIMERLSHDTFCGLDILDLIRNQKVRKTGSAGIMFTSLTDYSKEDGCWRKSYISTKTSQIWIDMIAAIYNSEVHFIWHFIEEMFDKSTAESIADIFKAIITNLCNSVSFWESTPAAFFENNIELLPLAENDMFTNSVKEKLGKTATNLFCLKDGNTKVQRGAIGKVYYADGTTTEYDGVYCNGKIRILGKSSNRIIVDNLIGYKDNIEMYAKRNDFIEDAALVPDDKSGEVYLFYTGDKELTTSELDSMFISIQLPLCRFKYKKCDKIWYSTDGEPDTKRLLKRKGDFKSLFS